MSMLFNNLFGFRGCSMGVIGFKKDVRLLHIGRFGMQIFITDRPNLTYVLLKQVELVK